MAIWSLPLTLFFSWKTNPTQKPKLNWPNVALKCSPYRAQRWPKFCPGQRGRHHRDLSKLLFLFIFSLYSLSITFYGLFLVSLWISLKCFFLYQNISVFKLRIKITFKLIINRKVLLTSYINLPSKHSNVTWYVTNVTKVTVISPNLPPLNFTRFRDLKTFWIRRFFHGVYSILDYNYKPPKCKLIDFNQFLTTARALIDLPQNPSNLTFYKHLEI